MSGKEEKVNITEKSKIKVSQPYSENKNILIGNKREREREKEETKKEEIKEDNNIVKICKYCYKIYDLDILEIDKTTQKQNIINFIYKNIKDESFLKLLKENIDNILIKKEQFFKNNHKTMICLNCFFNSFIIGGLEKIFKDENNENNFQINDLINNDQKNLKQIVDIYSINLKLAINSLKKIKSKYSKVLGTTNEVFENAAIRIMFSNNKEAFQELKKKMDNCKQNLEEVNTNFDILINNLTSKEELKKCFIQGVFSNDDLSKNKLLTALKQLENEIEINNMNNNGGLQIINNRNDKSSGMPDYNILYNIDKNKDDNKNKENNDKNNNKNNNNMQKNINNIQNNINNNSINNNNSQFLNLQNQKKPNINDQLLLNNFDKTEMLKNNLLLPQNSLIQNTPDISFINPNLGLFQSYGPQSGRIPNSNILINNLFPAPTLSPQLISQINSNQINSIFPNNNVNNTNNNNNSNDNNKNNLNNANNLNNITFPSINGYLQRPNFFFNNANDYSLKEIENMITMKNLINNSTQNNLINNLYNNQLNQNPLSLPISLNNFNSSPIISPPNLGTNFGSTNLPLYNNLLNIQGNNCISNLTPNNIDQNKLNQLNILSKDKNLININNNKGTNINNINDMNSINNINNLNGINNLGSLSGLNNNFGKNEITNNNLNYNRLLDLFNSVAQDKMSKSVLKNDNNLNNKNNLNNNNNSQIEMNNNNEQNNTQTQIDSADIKSAPINIENSINNNYSNNIKNNYNATTVNADDNNSIIPHNIDVKNVNNLKEKEQIKKEN